MEKIATVFVRDWEGDPSRVLDEVTPGCEWVFEGEGVATRKYDGTACMLLGGRMFKRHVVREGKERPDGFIETGYDEETLKTTGWLPVGSGPEDRWHQEAFGTLAFPPLDGTYELVGPKVQRNPERFEEHQLIRHSEAEQLIVPRDFEGLRALLRELDVEGIVFHHPDGRMAKIKGRDFGVKRPVGSPDNVTARGTA